MRKIFAGFLITVIMLSGCGVARKLEKPGSKPVPTLKSEPIKEKSIWDWQLGNNLML
jgi:uncharacterized protein YceK